MAKSIMDAMQENVNPTSVSNALYELMVDWFATTTMQAAGTATKSGYKKLRSKRHWIETTLGRFFNLSNHEMREMLESHYGIKVPVTGR